LNDIVAMVLVFAHREILDLATASVSTLGYDHGLDEPVIRLLNDARHV